MSDSATPGWYHAEGDPPDTERYWDGWAWTEGPRPIGGGDAPSDAVDGGDSPATPDMPITGSDVPTEMPAMGSASSMPVTGPDTEVSGLDAGFPSIDSPSVGSYGAGSPDLPSSSAPGGFSSVTPPSSTPPGAVPPFGAPPVPGMGGPGAFPGVPQSSGVMGGFPEASQATMSLVFSVVGLFCCGAPALAGIYFGYNEKKAIDSGRRDPSNNGQVVASFVIGGLALVVWGFVALIWLAIGFSL